MTRKRTRPVIARCLSCDWQVIGYTWRPVRRKLAEHVAKLHEGMAKTNG